MWSFKDTGVWVHIMLEESDAFSREMVMCHEHHQLSLLQWTRPWDWFLNPVSMLHYNTDFMYFTTHLLQRTMGITLRTKVPTWIPVMDKVMLDLITTKAMSCHGKDVKLDCRGSNRADSFYVILRLTAGCFLDCHKSVWKPRAQDWIHMWMDTNAPIF